jgi:ProP effector
LIWRFKERWPAAFGRDRPLRVGVGVQIVEAFAGEATKSEIGLALRVWTRRSNYLACIAGGNPRVALDGERCGPVSPEQREHAGAVLAERQAHAAAKKAAAP